MSCSTFANCKEVRGTVNFKELGDTTNVKEARDELQQCKHSLLKERLLSKKYQTIILEMEKSRGEAMKVGNDGLSSKVEPERKSSHLLVQRLKEQLREKSAEIIALQNEVQKQKNTDTTFESEKNNLLQHECYMAVSRNTEEVEQYKARCRILEEEVKSILEKNRRFPQSQQNENGRVGEGNQIFLENIAQLQKENWTLRHQLSQAHVKIKGEHTHPEAQTKKKHTLVGSSDTTTIRAARYAAGCIEQLRKSSPTCIFQGEDGYVPEKLVMSNILVAVQTLSDCVGHKLLLELRDVVAATDGGGCWTCWCEVIEKSWENQNSFQLKHLSKLQRGNCRGNAPQDSFVSSELPEVKLAAAAACLQITQNSSSILVSQHQNASALIEHLKERASTTMLPNNSKLIQVIWAKKKASGGTVYEFLLHVEGKSTKEVLHGGGQKRGSKKVRGPRAVVDASNGQCIWLLKCQMFLPIDGWDGIRLLSADIVEGPAEVNTFLGTFFDTLEKFGADIGNTGNASNDTSNERLDLMRLQLEDGAYQFNKLREQLIDMERQFSEFEVQAGKEKLNLIQMIRSLKEKLAEAR
jgi:hypothetical protein